MSRNSKIGKLEKSVCKEKKRSNQNMNTQNIITFNKNIRIYQMFYTIGLVKKKYGEKNYSNFFE